jgi:hypothetical protein
MSAIEILCCFPELTGNMLLGSTKSAQNGPLNEHPSSSHRPNPQIPRRNKPDRSPAFPPVPHQAIPQQSPFATAHNCHTPSSRAKTRRLRPSHKASPRLERRSPAIPPESAQNALPSPPPHPGRPARREARIGLLPERLASSPTFQEVSISR